MNAISTRHDRETFCGKAATTANSNNTAETTWAAADRFIFLGIHNYYTICFNSSNSIAIKANSVRRHRSSSNETTTNCEGEVEFGEAQG